MRLFLSLLLRFACILLIVSACANNPETFVDALTNPAPSGGGVLSGDESPDGGSGDSVPEDSDGEGKGSNGHSGGSDNSCGSNHSPSGHDHSSCSRQRTRLVCHVPPGNCRSRHELRVPVSAVRAHLEHGDYLGECE